jgi:hypothetical protein
MSQMRMLIALNIEPNKKNGRKPKLHNGDCGRAGGSFISDKKGGVLMGVFLLSSLFDETAGSYDLNHTTQP